MIRAPARPVCFGSRVPMTLKRIDGAWRVDAAKIIESWQAGDGG